MKFQYKRVDITTLKGLKQAERLKANGWTIIASSFLHIPHPIIIDNEGNISDSQRTNPDQDCGFGHTITVNGGGQGFDELGYKIVRAVNCHDELVEKLTKVSSFLCEHLDHNDAALKLYDESQTLLKKARGEK